MPRSQLRLPLAAVFVALVALRHRPAGSWARRRLVAGLRSAAPQALSLPPPHPLSFLRRRLVGVSMRSSHCQDPAGSTAPLLVIRSEVLLCTRWRAHTVYSKGVLTHGTLITAYATHNSTPGRRRRGRVLSSPEAQARSDQIIALPSVPRQEGHWATARASTARSEVNYFASISGKLVELDAFGAPSSPRTRSAAHSAPILRTPLAGAAPSRRSVPKLVDEVRAHARREHAARAAARGASHAQEISNAWVAAGGARLLQARQFPRAVSASASVAHRTNEKISWRPCKCLYVLCLVCHMFCDVWLVIFWLCLDGFKRKNLNLDFARYCCRTQKAGGPRPTGRYIDLLDCGHIQDEVQVDHAFSLAAGREDVRRQPREQKRN